MKLNRCLLHVAYGWSFVLRKQKEDACGNTAALLPSHRCFSFFIKSLGHARKSYTDNLTDGKNRQTGSNLHEDEQLVDRITECGFQEITMLLQQCVLPSLAKENLTKKLPLVPIIRTALRYPILKILRLYNAAKDQ